MCLSITRYAPQQYVYVDVLHFLSWYSSGIYRIGSIQFKYYKIFLSFCLSKYLRMRIFIADKYMGFGYL